jgi:SAM-dependent methyltransferase
MAPDNAAECNVCSVRWIDAEVATLLRVVAPDYIQSIKEVVRHVLVRMGLTAAINTVRRWRGTRTGDSTGTDPAKAFEEIYEKGLWVQHSGQESLSGTGSSRAATKGLISALSEGMELLGCKSLVDVGCGDWNWMQSETFRFQYLGIDIVESVIARNQEFSRPGVSFARLDAIREPLPGADMALCREVLFHLSFSDAHAVLRNIARSCRYLCVTSDADVLFNSDVPSGDFRCLNLLRRPFALPYPIAVIPDRLVRRERFLCVWPSSAIAHCA